MPNDTLLVVFVKNPERGKVKTRLAKTVGEKKALQVYRELLYHTCRTVELVNCGKAVFYSSFIDKFDMWDNERMQKFVQSGKNLGARMKKAFEKAFALGYGKVVIIGSDCYQLTAPVITEAFTVLSKKDVVLGPATDGGYYLLGMKRLHVSLFKNKKWSSSDVLLDTILDLKKERLSYALLETLSDLDSEEDLKRMKLSAQK